MTIKDLGGEGGWEVVVRNKKERKPQPSASAVATTPTAIPPINIANNKNKVSSTRVVNDFVVPKENEKEAIKEKAKKSIAKKPKEKKKEIEKVKPPKTLEQALSAITEAEMRDACETMALSDIARFLNSKLTVTCNEDLYFNSLDYPLSIVPSKIKQLLLNAIMSKSHVSNLHHCIEFCLSSIAYCMVKDLPVAGYRIMIQCIANVDPVHFAKCTSKLNNTMSSFQNRPVIGLALLWSIGQGGLKDFDVGLQVWKQSMVPMIEMKHYYRYVVDYLVNLIRVHSMDPNSAKVSIKPDDFMFIINFIYTKRKIYSREVEKLLSNQIALLSVLCFEKSESWKKEKFLETLFDELPNYYYSKSQSYDARTEEIIKILVNYLLRNYSTFVDWTNLYSKNLKKSSHVLNYIEKNWRNLPDGFNQKMFLKHMLQIANSYQRINDEDSCIGTILSCCQNIEKKSSSGKRGFPWIKGCIFLLFVIIVAAITYDVQVSGSYEKTHTARITKVALEYSSFAASKSLAASARGYIWMENNAPHYYAVVSDFAKPYATLACDMVLIVSNHARELYGNMREYIVEKWPTVRSGIDHYAPNLLDTLCSYTCTAWTATKDFTQYYFEITVTYLKTKVFVDNWAPEVLQAKTLEALNTTRIYAVEYYKRFHQQVDNYSKL